MIIRFTDDLDFDLNLFPDMDQPMTLNGRTQQFEEFGKKIDDEVSVYAGLLWFVVDCALPDPNSSN